MNQRTKKMIIAVICIVIAIMMILGCVAPVLMSDAASGSLDSQYSALQKEQKEIEKQQETLKAKIKENQSDQDSIKQQIKLIDNNMSLIKQQIDLLSNQIKDCSDDIEAKNTEIENTQKNIENNTVIYKQRVCAMYEVGQVSRLSILLSSKDMREFLTRYDILKMIQKHDKDLIASLKSDKEKLQSAKAQLETKKKQLDGKKSSLDSQKNKYEQQNNENTSLFKKLKDQSSLMQSQIDELDKAEEAASKKIADIIRQKEEEARKQAEASGGSTSFVGGGWLFPIQNITCYISSPFGPRAGHKVPHSGVDIAAGGINGHPILASNDGKVIIAGYDSSGIYGNYVVIDHGGGFSTLYGHAKALNTSVGATVKKGQVIAYVGNTGNVVSLGGGGYHLHFEIRKNGTAVNPMNYVKLP